MDLSAASYSSAAIVRFPAVGDASHLLPGEEHARRRLALRYGLELSAELRALILGLIARAPDGRHPRACRVELQFRDRERWLVSVASTILDVVVEFVPGRAPYIVTFLPPSYRWGRA